MKYLFELTRLSYDPIFFTLVKTRSHWQINRPTNWQTEQATGQHTLSVKNIIEYNKILK